MDIEKLDLQTPDLVNENFEKLAELFPNCVTEAAEGKAIDFDILRQELSYAVVEGAKERYRLEWPGKREAIVEANLLTNKTLRPIREESVDFDNTENIYIEGDNLEALKILQESYLGKIKMIYIDPPYNTGNDIIYKNDFSTNDKEYIEQSGQITHDGLIAIKNFETDGKYHSNWLNMMYPKLKLSRNLLTKDGFIIVAIDHYELNTLICMCNEIFGEQNKIGVITVVHKPEGRNQAKFFAPSNEFMLFYCKNKEYATLNNVILDDEIQKTYDRKDEKGVYRLNNYLRSGGGDHNLRINKPHFFYPIYVSKDLKNITTEYNQGFFEIYPITSSGQERTWKTKKETFIERLKNGEILAEKDNKGKVQIYEKYRESQILKTHWQLPKYHAIHHGTNLVSKLLGNSYFDFPKSLYLVMDVLKIITNENDIILDYFAGSSTTAHSVMKINSNDKGKRKYIMVQIPEKTEEESEAYRAGYKNICEIGKERIRRAGQKIKEETEADIDYGFRVYRIDSSNMKDVYYKPSEYKQANLEIFADNIKEDRTAEDLLTQVMLDWGLQLSLKIEKETVSKKTVYKVAENSLYACFDEGIDEEFAKAIAKDQPLRIVFRDSGFKNDTAKTNVKQLLKQLSPETEMKVI